jgi:hypothetical protein
MADTHNVEHVAFDEALCLEYDPFADDFGDPGDRILRDKICTARKPGPCHLCAQQIVPGTRTRSLSAKFDGELRSCRWCVHCCAAMAEVHKDRPEGDETEPFAAIEARYALRGRA